MLSLTERNKGFLDEEEYRQWQKISATCADLREGNII